MNEEETSLINFSAEALIANRNNIKTGQYKFNDPENSNSKCVLSVFICSGINIHLLGSNKVISKKTAATKDNLTLAMGYKLSCQIKILNKLLLVPTKDNFHNWPRSSEGRNYMEDTFLTHINYFFDNFMYLSSHRNPDHKKLMNVRPIGSQDIIMINFFIKGKLVASQGNSIFGRLLSNKLHKDDKDLWPPNAHLTRMFSSVPVEHKLLTRSYALLNIGFYQEAILVAFSVLDAKLQELIEKRVQSELHLEKK